MYHIILFLFAIIYSIFSSSFLLKGVSIAFFITFLFSLWYKKDLKRTYICAVKGSKNSYPLLIVFLLLGILSASWFDSGTIPALVYYGAKVINLKYFCLSVFVIVSVFSFLLGSAFGTVGTIGLVMMSLAKGLGINEVLVAGTIVSGAYFGDRGSPTSSSANLVATLTRTEIYGNVKEMFKTVWLPYVITMFIYVFFEKTEVTKAIDYKQIELITKEFNLSFYVFTPLIVLVVLCLFRVNIKKGMILSSLTGIFLGLFFQGIKIVSIFKSLILGYRENVYPALDEILKGGGIISMFTAIIMAYLSCAIIKIIEDTKILKKISDKIGKILKESTMFLYTTIVAIITSMVGCSQATTVLLTSQIMSDLYEESGYSKKNLAMDLENTSVVISPLIPWNISVSVPCMMMSISSFEILPYCYFLFLIPIMTYILKLGKNRKKVRNLI